MSLQNIVLLTILAILTESHCVFHNLLTGLIPSRDEYQTKLIPLGRFRLNFANEDSNLSMLPANGRSPLAQPVVSLFLKTYQPVQNPTPRERIRSFLQGINPFYRPSRPTPINSGFDHSYGNVVVNNLGSNQWNPIIPGRNNPNDVSKYYRGSALNSGTINNWRTNTAEPGDLKILGPNFKILLNHRNQQMLQEARNARHISKVSYDTLTNDLINSYRPSSSFGMASEYVSPTYGNQQYNIAENSYSNKKYSYNYKTDQENNSNSGFQVTQDEDYSDLSSALSPPGHNYNNAEPLTYMVPPPLQANNNNMYSYNSNYETGYSSDEPSYATKFITNPVRDHTWSNQYDNPFNQPYPNFYRYAGWNHRADSTEPVGRKYTTIPYSVNIPSNSKDKLMEKSDGQIDSVTEDNETSPNEMMITGEELSSSNKVEKDSNDLTDNLEPLDIDEEVPLF